MGNVKVMNSGLILGEGQEWGMDDVVSCWAWLHD